MLCHEKTEHMFRSTSLQRITIFGIVSLNNFDAKLMDTTETFNDRFLEKLMEKLYQIILIKFHLPARLRATGNDGFKHKVMMGAFRRDNFYGNNKLPHRKQQQQ